MLCNATDKETQASPVTNKILSEHRDPKLLSCIDPTSSQRSYRIHITQFCKAEQAAVLSAKNAELDTLRLWPLSLEILRYNRQLGSKSSHIPTQLIACLPVQQSRQPSDMVKPK